MQIDNPNIEAAFEEWSLGFDTWTDRERKAAWYGYLAGAAYGLAKRDAVIRASDADLSDGALSERIRLSNVAERIAADLNRLDVTG